MSAEFARLCFLFNGHGLAGIIRENGANIIFFFISDINDKPTRFKGN